ncbi:DUF924 family protein [soil metagenome]
MDRKVPADVYRYWFGAITAQGDVTEETRKRWFGAPVEVDNEIRDMFGRYLDEARAAEWDLGALSRIEQVGLIVLLDQFPRHIFRNSGEQFAYDARAREIARELVRHGIARFFPVERVFVTLPFMHHEDLADQEYCLWLTAGETVNAPEPARAGWRNGLDFSIKHRDIIRKFGRFPHRNAPLGRESTPEELEFLKGGRGF